MQEINRDDFEKASDVIINPPNLDNFKVSKEDFQKLLEKTESPIELQRELAVMIKTFLDKQMGTEMQNEGQLSEYVRRWTKEYIELLDRIQKNLYGDKSVNLHLHKVSHSDIASKMRKYGAEDSD